MNNTMMPPVQPSMQPGMQQNMQTGSLMQRAEASLNAQAKKQNDFIKTIAIVMLALVALTFIGLFIWVLIQYNDVRDDTNEKLQLAVAEARDEQRDEDEIECGEQMKRPYLDFVGPVDYGSLSFEYPRTWSLYIEADASNGGDYKAYFNPVQVNPVSKNTVNALRLTIRDKSFESVTAEYQKAIDRGSDLSVETIEVGGVVATKYAGNIPNTELNGYVVVFKIRDKTAILQMDAMEFEGDFDRILETIGFNA